MHYNRRNPYGCTNTSLDIIIFYFHFPVSIKFAAAATVFFFEWLLVFSYLKRTARPSSW